MAWMLVVYYLFKEKNKTNKIENFQSEEIAHKKKMLKFIFCKSFWPNLYLQVAFANDFF